MRRIPTHQMRKNQNFLNTLAVLGFGICSFNATASAQGCDINETVKLLASDGSSSHQLGYSIDASANTLAISAPQSNGTGSVYIQKLIGQNWVEEAILIPDDGTAAFGTSVALSANTLITGAIYDSDNGLNSGAAYIFHSDGINWTQQAKLLAADGEPWDYFGVSVAIDGNIAVVGSSFDNINGYNSGSVYVFQFDGTNWFQQAKLIPTDGAPEDAFGTAVAITGQTIFVGATGDDDKGDFSGSVYPFIFDGTQWIQQAKLYKLDTIYAWSQFGNAIDAQGPIAIVGSPGEYSYPPAGSATFFHFDGSQWVRGQQVTPTNAANGALFGWAVALENTTAVIGAYMDSFPNIGIQHPGSAYVFEHDGTQWNEHARLRNTDPGAWDSYGLAVAITGNTAIVSSPSDDDLGTASGSVYIFDTNCPFICQADLNNDGQLNFFDVSVFLSEFMDQSPFGDFNNDDTWNFFDVSAFLIAFKAGCP